MTKLTSGPGWALISADGPAPKQPASPRSPQPKVRMEKRSGKQVTIISGLHTYGTDRLTDMARELKTMCGAGGTVKNGTIEIQGDKTVQVLAWLKKRSTTSA